MTRLMGAVLSRSQRRALQWLAARNGDAAFDRNGVLLAAGESGPFTRSTWNALAKVGLLEFYRLTPQSKGHRRARLTDAGKAESTLMAGLRQAVRPDVAEPDEVEA